MREKEIRKSLIKGFVVLLLSALTLVAEADCFYVNGVYGSDVNSGKNSLLPKRTIQSAINASRSGDYVLVSGGTYHENLVLSKRITLFAQEPATAVVNGRLAGHCLKITDSAAGCVVDGLVFERGAPVNSGNKYGGGIECLADATIQNCVFRYNGEDSTTFAGALHTSNGSIVTVYNCLFYGNYAWACGGATLTEGGSTATFDRCTVYDNRSDNYIGNQGGIGVANSGTVIVKNSIVYGNTGCQIAAYGSYYGRESTIRVSYSCVQGGVAANGAGSFVNGGGNIQANPLFIATYLPYPSHQFDFRLAYNSPCVNAGNPADTDPNGSRANMGFNLARGHWGWVPPYIWEFTVSLEVNGGECRVASVKRNAGDRFGVLPEPVRENYEFLGWYTSLEGGRRIYPSERVVKNCTVYARWQQKPPVLFSIAGGTTVDSFAELNYILADGAPEGTVYLNGHDQAHILTSTRDDSNTWLWQPEKLGENVFIYDTGSASVTTKVNVVKLTFATEPVPAPPTSPSSNIMLSQSAPSKPVPAGGGAYSVRTQGSGTWSASSSVPWIILNSESGAAGDNFAFTVRASTNVAQRVGFIYVSGHTYTVTQEGYSADVSPDTIQCESEGCSGTIEVGLSSRFA